MSKRQFGTAMAVLRGAAEGVKVGEPAAGRRPFPPRHIQASNNLALWVDRLMVAREKRYPRHMIEKAEEKVALYRRLLREHAA